MGKESFFRILSIASMVMSVVATTLCIATIVVTMNSRGDAQSQIDNLKSEWKNANIEGLEDRVLADFAEVRQEMAASTAKTDTDKKDNSKEETKTEVVKVETVQTVQTVQTVYVPTKEENKEEEKPEEKPQEKKDTVYTLAVNSKVLSKDNIYIADEKYDLHVDTDLNLSFPKTITYDDNNNPTEKVVNDLAYVEVEEMFNFTKKLYEIIAERDDIINYSVKYISPTVVRITRTDLGVYNIYLEIDCENNTLYYNDYDMFFQIPGDYNSLSVFQEFCSVFTDFSLNQYIAGNSITFDLNKYGIQIKMVDGKIYMPLATFNDLVYTGFDGGTLVYNTEYLFLEIGSELQGTYKDFFYSVAGKKRSQELIDFNYKETCLYLDSFYGLKGKHKFKDFDSFIINNNLKEGFYSDDPVDADVALASVFDSLLADVHSGHLAPSCFSGADEETTSRIRNATKERMHTTSEFYSLFNAYSKLRLEADTDTNQLVYRDEEGSKQSNKPIPFKVVGDTAYITFDSFVLEGSFNLRFDEEFLERYDNNLMTIDEITDTISLVWYANQELQKDTSHSIKKVVIDISNNGGGMTDAMCYLSCWLGVDTFSLKSTLTGAIVTQQGKVDVNLDGEYDDDDIIIKTRSDIQFYCLESESSFSCGNELPALLKNSLYAKKVTVIGRKSSGGTCIVGYNCTPMGTYYQHSSRHMFGYVRNSTFYDVEAGVEPDYYINDYNLWYNRSELSTYLDTLPLAS